MKFEIPIILIIIFAIGVVFGAGIVYMRMNEIIIRDQVELKAKLEQLETERKQIDKLIQELEQYRLEINRVLWDTQEIRIFEMDGGK